MSQEHSNSERADASLVTMRVYPPLIGYTKSRNKLSVSPLLRGQLQHILDFSRRADPDRLLHRTLLFLLAPIISACGGGSGSGSGPRREVTLTSANPNHVTPDATESFHIMGGPEPNSIATGSGNDEITAGAGADTINAGAGADTINAGGGADTIVVLGQNAPGDAAYQGYGPNDLANPRGGGVDVSSVVRLQDLNNNAQDDGARDQIDGGADDDTLVVYGRTDLSLATLQGIETIIINSDVTLGSDQLEGVEQIMAGESAVLRLVRTGDSGMVDLSSLSLPDMMTFGGVEHIEIGPGVTLRVPDKDSLAGIKILSGTGTVEVVADDATAFEGIRLVEGLQISINVGSASPAEVVTVGVNEVDDSPPPMEVFGGDVVLSGVLLPSGGLRFDGTSDSARNEFEGTGSADSFSLGNGDEATGGGGGDLFIVRPASGEQVTINDFESGDRLRLLGVATDDVTVSARDNTLSVMLESGGMVDPIDFTQAVVGTWRFQDVEDGIEAYLNQGPLALPSQTFRINEDSAVGALVGMIDAFDPDLDELSYEIIPGSTIFAIDEGTGAITLLSPRDHETADEHVLMVRVSSSDGGPGGTTVSTDVTVTIEVADVNEAPEVSGDGSIEVNEGGTYVLTTGDVTAEDPDAGDGPAQLTFRVTSVPTNGLLALASAPTVSITTFTQAQLEAGQVVYVHDGGETTTDSFTVQAEDDEGTPLRSSTFTVAAAVTPVNDPPEVSGDGSIEVDEGATYTLTTSDVTAEDPDPGDGPAQLTFRVTSVPTSGRLALASAPATSITSFTQAQLEAGQVVYVHDGGETTTDSFTVRAEDDEGTPLRSGTFTVTAAVTPVNDSPELAAETFSVTPGAADGALVGTLRATDVDSPQDTLRYSIVGGGTAPAGLFAIGAATGAITVADSAQLGSGGTSYTLQVQVSDPDGGTNTAEVTINVGGVDLPVGASVDENAMVDMTYTLTFTGLTNGRVTGATTSVSGVTVTVVTGSTLRIQAGADVLDHESLGGALPISLTVESDDTPSFTATVNLPVADVNEDPEVSGDGSIQVNEGGTYVLTTGDVTAEDPDAGDGPAQLTLRVTSAPTNGRLALASAPTVSITTFTQAQLEAGQVVYVHDGGETTSDSFTVQAEDDEGTPLRSPTFDVTVTIAPVDDPPTEVSLSGPTTTLAEDMDTTSAVKVADINVTDPDGGPRGLELAGADASLFELNADQTELLLRAGAVLDFESNPRLDVVVRAAGNPSASASQAITVTNVDEPPIFAANQQFSVAVHSSADDDLVGTVDVDDPEGGSLQFSITAGNTGSAFAIDNNGRITIADASQLDATATPSYTLTIQVRDGTTHTVNGEVSITVTAEPQPPTGLSLSSAVVPSGQSGWAIGRLSATDPDGGADPMLSWTLSDARFEVSDDDILRLKDDSSLASEVTLTVTVEDSQGLSMTSQFTITPLSVMDGSDTAAMRDTALMAGASGGALRGLAGSDTLVGGIGDDILDGGLHDDDLTGGGGADVFVYRFNSSGASWRGVDGWDEILDYNPAEGDKILFIDESTSANRVSSLQSFKDAFSQSAGTNTYRVGFVPAPDPDVTKGPPVRITFGSLGAADSENDISGRHYLEISFEGAITASLVGSGSGLFVDADAFIEALGGADALLFG